MTRLTTYTVTFHTEHDSASEDIDAASPEAALAEARAIADDRDRLASLYFEPYSHYVPVDEIVVDSPDGKRVAEWFSGDLLLHLAAPDLFKALEKALIALNTAPRFDVPALDTDSYAIAADGGRAIRLAKGDELRITRPP
jgi:hypothetical protein